MDQRRLELRRRRKAIGADEGVAYDPGRERRAEQRARELPKSCVNEEEWGCTATSASYVSGAARPPAGRRARARRCPVRLPDLPPQADRRVPAADRAAAQRVLRRVPGRTRPYGFGAPARLHDVLAKWMALNGDERADHPGRHGTARPADRPSPGPARPLAPRAVGARALADPGRAGGGGERGQARQAREPHDRPSVRRLAPRHTGAITSGLPHRRGHQRPTAPARSRKLAAPARSPRPEVRTGPGGRRAMLVR